jgi:hypothetical protein
MYQEALKAVLAEIEAKGWTPHRVALKPEAWSILLKFRRGFWARNFRLTFHESASALEVLKCPLFGPCSELLTSHVRDARELKGAWNNIVQVIERSLSE